MKIIFHLFLCLLFAGCGKDDTGHEPDPVNPIPSPISLSTRTLAPAPEGERLPVTVTSSVKWMLSGQCSWCEPSANQGDGSEVVYFRIEANDSGRDREYSYTFESEDGTASATLRITQSQIAPSISVTESVTQEIAPAGGGITLHVRSNVDYQVRISSNDGSWLQGDNAGPRPSELTFSADANLTSYARSAKITLYVGTKDFVSIDVAQSAIEDVVELIPDIRFKLFCYNTLDRNKDGRITPSEANSIYQIDCSETGIASMEGIAYFPNITSLDCSANALTGTIDLSKNSSLTSLDCSANALSGTIDLSKNSSLQHLVCKHNNLTAIILPSNNKIQTLKVGDNPLLSSLNISSCPLLTELNCIETGFTTLDVSHNALLTSLGISYIRQLSDLELGEVDITKCYYDVDDETRYDDHLSFGVFTMSFRISGTKVKLLDLAIGTRSEGLTYTIDVSDCPALETLNLNASGNKIILKKRRSQNSNDIIYQHKGYSIVYVD